MKPVRGRVLPVLFAATVLVGGANIAAYAANGQPLLLGKANTETATAKVTNNGPGPALSLKSKSSAPSLAVSNTKKIARLNADQVDGLDGKSLQTRPYVFAIPDGSPAGALALSGIPAGTYQASFTAFTATTTTTLCYVGDSAHPITAAAYGVSNGSYSVFGGSGVVTYDGTHTLLFYCGAPLVSEGSTDTTVTLTRLDGVVAKTPTTPKAAGKLPQSLR